MNTLFYISDAKNHSSQTIFAEARKSVLPSPSPIIPGYIYTVAGRCNFHLRYVRMAILGETNGPPCPESCLLTVANTRYFRGNEQKDNH